MLFFLAGLKPKTLHFVIIPDAASQVGGADEEAYFAKLDKLLQLLRSKAKPNNQGSLTLDYIKQTDLRMSTDGSPEILHTGSTVRNNSRTVTKLWLPTPGAEASKWVTLCTDKRVRTNRVFHFDFYWIACDSWLMEELVGTLFIRCKNWGLRMAQTPEYFHTPVVQVHPYRCQPYVLFSDRYEKDPMVAHSKAAYIQRHFFEVSDSEWIRDTDQSSEWVTAAFIDAKKKLELLLNTNAPSNTSSSSTPNSSLVKSQSQSALSAAVAAEKAAGNLPTTPQQGSNVTSTAVLSPAKRIDSELTDQNSQVVTPKTIPLAAVDGTVLSPSKSIPNTKVEPPDAVALAVPALIGSDTQHSSTPPIMQATQSPMLRGSLGSFAFLRGTGKKHTGVATLNIPERKPTSFMPNQSKELSKASENKLNFMSKHDTQYLHRNGHSCVRFAPNGFVWMFSMGSKVSDLPANTDKEKAQIAEKIRDFFDRCKTVDVCVDILYDLIDDVCIHATDMTTK